MTLRRSIAALAALGLLLCSPGIAAHELDPTIRVVLDEVAPAVEGVEVQLVQSVASQLVVRNDSDALLEILDDDGRPFLRIGPDGAEANLGNPAWYDANSPTGSASIPDIANPGAPDAWARVHREPSWGWFDHRLHPVGVEPGEEWAVPARYDGRTLAIRGHLEQRSVRGAFVPELTSDAALTPELFVQLLPGRMPGLFLSNSGDETVVVRGVEGEPFIRLGPSGAEVNRRSESWRAHSQAQGLILDVDVDVTVEPEWTQLTPDRSVAWLEVRGLFPDEDPPDDVVDRGEPATLVEWEVPVEVGDDVVTITGVTKWLPIEDAAAADADDDANGALLFAVIVVATAAVLVVLLLRFRSSR